MKTFKKLCKATIMAVLFVFALGLLSACGGEDAFVGTWVSEVDNFEYHFRADGTGTRGVPPEMYPFNWRRERGNLILTEGTAMESWSYTLRGNTITFSHDEIPGYVFIFNRR